MRPPAVAGTAAAAGALAFAAALLVFAITRFWRLGEYPIYFFTDEAYLPVLAEQLLASGFRGDKGERLPVYFPVSMFTAPLLPVYFHVIPVALFGKSVEVARGTTAVCAVAGAAALALALRGPFRSRWWWTAPLFLATTPGWFHYSRTAFEAAVMASFCAVFLLFYLLYRLRSPWFLYPAILAAGVVFYSYSNGQAVTGVAGVALLLLDLPYHLRHRRHALAGALLVGLVAVPYLRYRATDPVGAQAQLQTNLRSYWYEPIPLRDKVARYTGEYLFGLSPQYWFLPNGRDLERHRMLGYAQIRTELLPLVLVGAAACLWRIRAVPQRTLLILTLAAPSGAAVAEVNVSRALAFAVLAGAYAVLGLDAVAAGVRRLWSRGGTRLPRAIPLPLPGVVRPPTITLPPLAGVLVFVVLAGSSFQLLYDALTNGPRWYRDYTLYGQQWGAKQVFDVVKQYVQADPQQVVYVTPTWANGSDMYPRFFFSRGAAEAARVHMSSIDDFLGTYRRDLSPKTVVVMTSEELARAQGSRKFASVPVERVLPYPDGRPGFHFARLTYAPDAEATFAAEREARRALVDGQVTLDGEAVSVRHSRLDAGSLREMFDGNRETLGRFLEANPAVIELRFSPPRAVAGLSLVLANGSYDVTARLSPDGADPASGESVVYTTTVRSPARDPRIDLAVDRGPALAGGLRLEIRNLDGGDSAKLHVRELQLVDGPRP